jgi:hypothetical protein
LSKLILVTVLLLSFFQVLQAAVGCDLNDPDRDVQRLFPGSSGYKTYYVSIAQKGGKALLDKVENRLGDKFTGMYETMDVPYTVYEIHKDKKVIGYIHGVNQKGRYGGIQIFLALDLQGKIKSFYFQKMTNQNAKAFRSPEFGKQFIGLSMQDFASFVPSSGKQVGNLVKIKNPAPKAEQDFKATLRGVKKNLILMEEFGYIKPNK